MREKERDSFREQYIFATFFLRKNKNEIQVLVQNLKQTKFYGLISFLTS